MALLLFLGVTGGLYAWLIYRGWRHKARARHIELFAWPPGLDARLARQHPEWSPAQRARVGHGLRQFFRAYLDGRRRHVTMPSQAVDDLWHEFILHTRPYQRFCQEAFGRFLHHAPAAVLGADRQRNAGLRRVWWSACRQEGIDPRRPDRLPLLFALDAELAVAGGFHYATDCAGLRRLAGPGAQAGAGGDVQCGSDFASPAFDGGTEGFGDSGGGDGHGGPGDGGGDGGGGDGCGGGCGGGD